MTDFNENEIRDAFEPFGDITSVEIPRDEYGRNNGSAYVTFEKG
jgi:RNA recognition motif-containing protein